MRRLLSILIYCFRNTLLSNGKSTWRRTFNSYLLFQIYKCSLYDYGFIFTFNSYLLFLYSDLRILRGEISKSFNSYLLFLWIEKAMKTSKNWSFNSYLLFPSLIKSIHNGFTIAFQFLSIVSAPLKVLGDQIGLPKLAFNSYLLFLWNPKWKHLWTANSYLSILIYCFWSALPHQPLLNMRTFNSYLLFP